jgi:PLP dependent protein
LALAFRTLRTQSWRKHPCALSVESISDRITHLQDRIGQAEAAAGRPPGSVRLIAVGKTFPASDLLAAYRAGLRHFGESYLQEALGKQIALGHCDITWHFIGPIQSNKSRPIATHFQWVHSVDRLKIAQRLNEQRPPMLPPLNVCLQVNISGEDSKSGVSPEELPALAHAVAALPRLRLRGLMGIPAPDLPAERQRADFRRLRAALEALAIRGLDTLSMGMSDDLEAAVMEGATMVRIGSALFGERARKPAAP